MSERRFTERFGRVRVTTSARPSDVPEDWVIMNAPRPLSGTRLLGDMRTPVDYAAEGMFVVAIDPSDPDAARHIAANRSLDACVLVFVPESVLLQLGAAYYVAFTRSDTSADALVKLLTGERGAIPVMAKAMGGIEGAFTPGGKEI